RRHAHPVGHRTGRPARRRAAAAARVRRAAPPGGGPAGAREARPDVAGDRAGPRGVLAAGSRRRGSTPPLVERPEALVLRRRRGPGHVGAFGPRRLGLRAVVAAPEDAAEVSLSARRASKCFSSRTCPRGVLRACCGPIFFADFSPRRRTTG